MCPINISLLIPGLMCPEISSAGMMTLPLIKTQYVDIICSHYRLQLYSSPKHQKIFFCLHATLPYLTSSSSHPPLLLSGSLCVSTWSFWHVFLFSFLMYFRSLNSMRDGLYNMICDGWDLDVCQMLGPFTYY